MSFSSPRCVQPPIHLSANGFCQGDLNAVGLCVNPSPSTRVLKKEKATRRLERTCLHDLLRRPLGVRMHGDVEVKYPSTLRTKKT